MNKSCLLKNGSPTPFGCSECRAAKNKTKGWLCPSITPNVPVVCAPCVKESMVPFRPSENRTVYCRVCVILSTRNNFYIVRRRDLPWLSARKGFSVPKYTTKFLPIDNGSTSLFTQK